jgi:hypothetical protein
MIYALVEPISRRVVNRVVWDGDEKKWRPPPGLIAVEAEREGNIGDEYRDGVFIPAPLPEPAAPEKLDMLVDLLVAKRLLSEEDVAPVKRAAAAIDAASRRKG